jgi:hypothetical protein
MVDFTKPVNNADMVKELNALIRCNMELCSYYEDLTPRIKDKAYQQPLASFKALHTHHAELIGDTVRLLGGAPAVAEGEHTSAGGRWLRRLYGGEGKLNDFVKAEEKLRDRYRESLQDQAVRASPECVAVINQVLADSRAALSGFRDAVDSEGGEI